VRLAWLLVRLTRLCDAVEDDGALGLLVDLSHADLALWIGAGRSSVETALKAWRSRGVVARRHGKLVIRDLDPLIKTVDIPADRRAVTQPRTPAWRLARPAGRHGAAVERPDGRHVGATAARTGNHAARGRPARLWPPPRRVTRRVRMAMPTAVSANPGT